MRIVALACFTALLALHAPAAALAQHVHELGYVAILNGASQSPPNNSQGVGTASVMIDLVFFAMHVRVDFHGLTGAAAAATIHGPTDVPGEGAAGAMTQLPSLPDFPVGATAGVYDKTISLGFASSYNPDFITASGGTVSLASNALFAALAAGRTYFSLGTTAFGDGEISGFLFPTPPADFNFDGVVGGADLPVWGQSFGLEHHGDANGDGITTGDDFLVWQQQLGAVASLGAGHGHIVAAPEPGANGLAAVAVLAAGSRCRNRKTRPALNGNLLARACGLGHDTGR